MWWNRRRETKWERYTECETKWGEVRGRGSRHKQREYEVHFALGTKRILSLFSQQLGLRVVSIQEGLAKPKQFQYPCTSTADNAKPLHSWESPIWLICGFHSKSMHLQMEKHCCSVNKTGIVKYNTVQPVLSSHAFQQSAQWTVATDQMSVKCDPHCMTDIWIGFPLKKPFQRVFNVLRGIKQSNTVN